MKKVFIAAMAILFSGSILMAQAPNRLSYQSVVRNSSGTLLANSQVGVRISILKTSATGAAQYVERHTPTTNANGLIDLQIGGGSLISGNYANINWTNDTYFIKTDVDPTGGSAYTISGTSQILAAPYALNGVMNGKLGVGATAPSLSELHVKASSGNGDVSLLPSTGKGWNFAAMEASGELRIASFDGGTGYSNHLTIKENGHVGIGTINPLSKLHIQGNQANGDVCRIVNSSNNSSAFNNGIHLEAGVSNYTGTVQGLISFYTPAPTNTYIGAIQQNSGNSVSYNTTSDVRLKTDLSPTKYGLNALMKIQVLDYKYKNDKNTPQTGFLAQQLHENFPMAVTPGGADPATNPWLVDYGKLSPLLVKSIQEQQAQMEALKAENAALKAENEVVKAKFQSQLDVINAKLEALAPTETARK